MIYREIPEEFEPRFDVVSCFVEANGEVLFLHRQDNKSEGNRWGIPAGKIEEGETELEAMVREIREETGLDIPAEKIAYFNKVYVRYPEYDFVYHMLYTKLDSRPIILLDEREHKDFSWVLPQAALKMPLVLDEDACIKLFYGMQGNTDHHEIEKRILEAIQQANALEEVQAAIGNVLQELSGGRIGYVSGIVTSDGIEKIEENLQRLKGFSKALREKYGFPIFSPSDVFPKDVLGRVQENGATNESFVQFWRAILNSGYITDIFMTPRWENSHGATDEHQVAQKIGLRIHYL